MVVAGVLFGVLMLHASALQLQVVEIDAIVPEAKSHSGDHIDQLFQTPTEATQAPAPSSLATCELGCDACGYNWYAQNYDPPSESWNSNDCKCCMSDGGNSKTSQKFQVCKTACAQYVAESGKRCTGTPFTVDSAIGCDGWSGLTDDECYQKCSTNAQAPNCPSFDWHYVDSIEVQYTCAAAVFYPSSGWCHLYESCASTEVDSSATLLKASPTPAPTPGPFFSTAAAYHLVDKTRRMFVDAVKACASLGLKLSSPKTLSESAAIAQYLQSQNLTDYGAWVCQVCYPTRGETFQYCYNDNNTDVIPNHGYEMWAAGQWDGEECGFAQTSDNGVWRPEGCDAGLKGSDGPYTVCQCPEGGCVLPPPTPGPTSSPTPDPTLEPTTPEPTPVPPPGCEDTCSSLLPPQGTEQETGRSSWDWACYFHSCGGCPECSQPRCMTHCNKMTAAWSWKCTQTECATCANCASD